MSQRQFGIGYELRFNRYMVECESIYKSSLVEPFGEF